MWIHILVHTERLCRKKFIDLELNQNIQRTVKVRDQYRNQICKIILVSNHWAVLVGLRLSNMENLMDLNLVSISIQGNHFFSFPLDYSRGRLKFYIPYI